MSRDGTPDLSSLLFTRAPLALSRTQRLVTTWLPPPTAEDLARNAQSSETQREEDEIFKPTSELSGLGATYTAEDEKESLTVRSDEKLRLLLLGKNPKTAKRNQTTKSPVPLSLATRANPPLAPGADLSSEDEGGRTSLGKSKLQTLQADVVARIDIVDDGAKDVSKQASNNQSSRPDRRRKSANYLDMVLAEKAQRDRKRMRRINSSVDKAGAKQV